MPKAGWVEILKRSIKQFKHDDITDRAAALTYFGVLAIFPAMLVLVSVLGLLGKSTTKKVLDNLGQVAPGGVKSFLTTRHQAGAGQGRHRRPRRDHRPRPGAVVGVGLRRRVHARVERDLRRRRGPADLEDRARCGCSPRSRWSSCSSPALVMVVVTGPIASQVGKAFGIGDTAVLIWNIAKWPVLLVVVSLMFSLLYDAAPNVKQPKFRWITPGGVIAVVVWLIASGLFALYVVVLRLVQQDLRRRWPR